MPRPLNPKCQLCSKFSTTQAKVLHGSEGDGCWNPHVCHNRRSFYRQRIKQDADVETVNVEPPATYFAVLYLYKEPGDKPLHALGAQLWHGQKPICRLEPIHCFGLTAGKIKTYTEQVLQAFSRQYEIPLSQYKEMFEVSPIHCPVRPCPLHPELSR
ncbi:hypothetical protein Cylst_6632 (plasmid) [Cylindrospermum stagnale PCC 7417]|uniref:Uncharacterized protein n=1 Tax=Cylindrospermum stagnale PCC 7417 TaxID=56107 RepID=K9X824_9NOST|nr:hypothetical protein [Cylindrospermum stagnale]AFZ28226.1 hypothetical protein Cylst_6435 [Cylindrospermum stagnale PCC 7417]AFZ28401.1 hypothetical protein Cylst_6632 [Cylindrospermum stagnale PCC 7417]